MKLQPLNDRIIVKRTEEEEVTKGGIIIPDSAKEKPIQGKNLGGGHRQGHGGRQQASPRCQKGRYRTL